MNEWNRIKGGVALAVGIAVLLFSALWLLPKSGAR